MRKELSLGQTKVLEAIRRRVEDGASPPTYRELCDEFGWRSTGTARDYLRALARKGYIELPDGRARQIRLIEEHTPAVQVPILGQVVAGVPVDATEDPDGSVPVPRSWLRGGRHFALHVYGDSMIGAGIMAGDLVLVAASPVAADGEVVVASVDGETTIKRFQSSGRGAELVPENPSFQSIPLERGDVLIHGVVVGLLRRFSAKKNVTHRPHALRMAMKEGV